MKGKILTITPNPSLDISGVVERIRLNEKTYVESEERAPGGNAINVARILHRLGVQVTASGFLGGGIGEQVASLLKIEGINRSFKSSTQHALILRSPIEQITNKPGSALRGLGSNGKKCSSFWL